MKLNNDIILIRHAENKYNEKLPNNLLPLSKRGIIQAIKARRILKGKYDIVISSVSKRAKMTAKIISRTKPLISDPRLLERGWGNINQDGKETDGEAKERFKNFLKEINQEYNKERILIVTHGSLMKIAQDVIEEQTTIREPIDNCTMIEYNAQNQKKLIRTIKK